MNWYKCSQVNEYGYHGTDPEKLEIIKVEGLRSGSFFAGNESDCSPYTDGVLLRFPFPENYEKRIGRGDYYTSLDNISPSMMEVKFGDWGDWNNL